jgi:ABC-type sugar transport system substrate-binding protein
MRSIENVVDFSDLCIYAESNKIAFYNAAHDILRQFWPDQGSTFVLYLGETEQYTDDAKAIQIIEGYIKSKGVDFININAG